MPKHSLLILVVIFWFAININLLIAQTSIKATPVKAGIKYYQGRIDDINDVSLSLLCENRLCKGELVYLRSKDKFKITGTIKDNKLDLREHDARDKITGFLKGSLEGDYLKLEWHNQNATIGNSLNLQEVQKEPSLPTFCGDNKWIEVYKGLIKQLEIDLILQRVDKNRIVGHAYLKKDGRKLIVKGELTENDNLNLTLFDENNLKEFGVLKGVYYQNKDLRVSFYDAHNIQSFTVLTWVNNMEVNCLEYADFYTSYDFLLPKTKSAIFNEMLSLLTKDWISDCRTQTQKMRRSPQSIELRASQRAYGWTDIDFLTKDYVSGLLTYYSTWSGEKETKSFTYHFKSGEFIELQNIFDKGFDYQGFVKKYISEEIMKIPMYKYDNNFRQWIKNEPFIFFTIGQEGISFYTDFNIIYDRQRILIPYKKLKSHIRKNSPIKELL